MKRLLTTSSFALLLMVGFPAIASAHVLKIDGQIGAVLHINPDDNPTTGSPTDYTLSFDDDSGKFNILRCNCSVAIIEHGKVIADKSLNPTDYQFSDNFYTFEDPDVYIMHVTGMPKQPGDFQPFTLNYEVRVTGGQTGTQQIPLLLWVGIGMAIVLIMLAAYATNTGQGKKLKDWKEL